MVVPSAGVQANDLFIFSGQSNTNGTTQCPTPVSVGIVNPNINVRIWDRMSGAPAFRSLQAGVNNNNHLMNIPVGPFYGPEMSFATFLMGHYQNALGPPLAVPMQFPIVKSARDSAALFPTFGDFCFHPQVSGNLYNDVGGVAPPTRGTLKGDIQAAITALGGPQTIRQAHLFWHQGESDGLFQGTAQVYDLLLHLFFDTIRADFPSIDFVFHVVLLHKDLLKGTSPVSLDGFWYSDIVREKQKIVVSQRSDCRLITIDHIPMSNDRVHFDQGGTFQIGKLCFDSWLASLDMSTLVDEFGPSDDNITAGHVNLNNRDWLLRYRSPALLRGGEVLATTRRTRASAPAGTDSVTLISSKDGVTTPGPSLTIPSTWGAADATEPTSAAPEDINRIQRGYRS
jgi:hypothetical protein